MASLVASVLNMSITFTIEHFWTGSKVVLTYIRSIEQKFHTYVSNRVQQILERSNPTQWHYVSTNDNPADVASGGVRL